MLLSRASEAGGQSLVAEQELRARPALVLLHDKLISQHPDVGDEHRVDLAAAVDRLDRS